MYEDMFTEAEENDDDGWVYTPDKDISFEHCGRPAYWEGEEVYCSKCSARLTDTSQINGPVEKFKVVLPYAETSGWSGSDTSKERAEKSDRSGRTAKNQQQVLEFLANRGELGATVREVDEALGWHHHGKTSGCLSVLHKGYEINRLAERRGRCKIYVTPNHTASRAVEEHRGNITTPESNATTEGLKMISLEQADVMMKGHPVLVNRINRVLDNGGSGAEVISAVASWLESYRPAELKDTLCPPLDVTAFILRAGEVLYKP